jgi:hypothetical protein
MTENEPKGGFIRFHHGVTDAACDATRDRPTKLGSS